MIEIRKEIQHKNLPVFASEAFLSSRSDTYGWICDEDRILPFIVDQRYIFKRLVFTTGVLNNGIELSVEEERQFLENAIAHIKSNLSVDLVAKAQANVVFKAAPSNSIHVPWGTYYKNIQQSDEDLIASIKGTTRNRVRRAMKASVTVEEASAQEFWEVTHETFMRQGESLIAPSMSYVNQLSSNLGRNFLMLKAVKEGEIQGVLGIPFDSNSGYYLYGGSIRKPFTGSINLLHFEAMKRLRDMGVKYYDFVGARIDPPENTKYYNIQRFKKTFNPELKEGLAFKVVIKPWKYQLMNISIKLYMAIKGKKYEGDPIDQIRRHTR